jgi:L-rhamnose mutarotase
MRFCMVLDLQDDSELIEEYLAHHRNVWPEILASIHESGIRDMEIFQVEDRLVMLIETQAGFSFAGKSLLDERNAAVQRWEALMSRFQKPLRNTAPAEKWRLASRVFSLAQSLQALDDPAENSVRLNSSAA